MKDNKLDKFFREKSEENLPDFDPKFWEQAERMLDDALPEEEDRKRGAWWWWLPLLLIGGCGVCWFVPFEKDGNWMNMGEKVQISEEKSTKTENELEQIDFENKIQNTKSQSENINEIANEKTAKSVNSTKNSSTSLKNAIANIGQNDAPIMRSKEFLKKKNSINSEANSTNKDSKVVPTEIAKTTNSKIDKTPNLIPEIPNTDEDLPVLDLLLTLDADFLAIPLVEIEDSLTLDSMKLQNLVNPKKLGLGWSAEIVAREEIAGDVILTKVASFRTGLTVDYNLSKRWDLHFDFLGRREISKSVKFVNIDEPQGGKAYGFGGTEITNLYRFKTQYFLEGVGLIRYKLHERHAIGAGIGLKYLLAVRADLIQRQEEIIFDFDEYGVFIDNRDELIDSGWWEKENTKDLLPFAQFRYDFRPSRNFTLFFKMNAEYNRGWYREKFEEFPPNRRLLLETSFGLNYQF